MSFPIVKPLETQEELAALRAAALTDGHSLVAPSHVIIKDGEPAGYLAMHMPMVFFWADSERMKARDSVFAIQMVNNMMKIRGVHQYMVPVADDSPFLDFLPKMGFEKVMTANLLTKKGT